MPELALLGRPSLTAWHAASYLRIRTTVKHKSSLREQQCSLSVAASRPASYVRMRTIVKHHTAGTMKNTVRKIFVSFSLTGGCILTLSLYIVKVERKN